MLHFVGITIIIRVSSHPLVRRRQLTCNDHGLESLSLFSPLASSSSLSLSLSLHLRGIAVPIVRACRSANSLACASDPNDACALAPARPSNTQIQRSVTPEPGAFPGASCQVSRSDTQKRRLDAQRCLAAG